MKHTTKLGWKASCLCIMFYLTTMLSFTAPEDEPDQHEVDSIKSDSLTISRSGPTQSDYQSLDGDTPAMVKKSKNYCKSHKGRQKSMNMMSKVQAKVPQNTNKTYALDQ